MIESFLEYKIRGMLTAVYDAIIHSNKNANLLSKLDMSNIKLEKYGGNDSAVRGMNNVLNWILETKEDFDDKNIYDEQIIQPIRLSAQSIVNMMSKTTTIIGWVFEISQPYDAGYGKIRTISIIVPELKTNMCLRIKDDKCDSMENQFYEFERVKPIPWINRMHQQKYQFIKHEKKLSIKDWDFLKIGFGDYEEFSTSIEMENFCEIESSQHNGRHKLSTVFIMCAKIMEVREPEIIIRSILDDTMVTFGMSDDMEKNISLSTLKEYTGKFVRLLAMQTYAYDPKAELTKRPELIFAELIPAPELLEDDFIGYVRMRRCVDIVQINNRYGKSFTAKFKNISLNNNVVSYHEEYTSADPVCNIFLQTVQKLHKLRDKQKMPENLQIQLTQLLGDKPLSVENLASNVLHNGSTWNLLKNIKQYEDRHGIYPTIEDLNCNLNYDKSYFTKIIKWFIYVELVKKIDKNYKISRKGHDVLINIHKRFSKKIKENNLIDLSKYDVENIPPSIISDIMSVDNNFIALKINDHTCKSLWYKIDNADKNNLDAKNIFNELAEQIMDILKQYNYSLTTIRIVELLNKKINKYSFYGINMILITLEKLNKIDRDDKSWIYTHERKIYDYLNQNSNQCFKIDELIRKLLLPNQLELISNILNKMKNKNRIFEIKPGLWSSNTSSKTKNTYYEPKIKSEIYSMLNENSAVMKKQDIVTKISEIVSHENLELNELEIIVLIDMAIQNLITDGKIFVTMGEWYKVCN